ncbi:transglutaminase family protein [Sphingomonas nostoxanthinifaciens]|uniref:transglutaminase family protein n=1 Tax=Sphingomonas nostoxanthinifaciens TaxID=2872652 RepID=UPI001CC219E9|nr:transglutaminase family protein [Sphingomonas nostoxanthinifaciens]UAK24687.1 transglutaminase family protein [Sphingomonas nostoxanthinifaciens]
MRLHVVHRTEYRFSEPQSRLVQLLRLTPGNHAGQCVVAWTIEVDRDARLKPARDGFGNETTMLYVDGPLDRIAITVAGEVLTDDRAGMIAGTPETLAPPFYLQSTPLTRADAGIADFVASLELPAERLSGAHQLAESLHERLVLTDIGPAVDESAIARFAEGKADPRGAAHLLIAAARSAGYPARYVAGHLYRPYEADAHAAHGWAELYVAGYGWIGFDAHEGRCPTSSYVRVAVGLDYHQAAPISGARVGGGGEALAIDIHVGPEPAPQD